MGFGATGALDGGRRGVEEVYLALDLALGLDDLGLGVMLDLEPVHAMDGLF